MSEEQASQILRPPKLYIDTNHLINIANVRDGRKLSTGQSSEAYSFIDKRIHQHFGVIFNPFAPLEWVEGKATEESANQIAAVIDSAKLKYQLEEDSFVYTAEVLNECHQRDSSISVPKLPIMHLLSDGGSFKPAIGTLSKQVPDYFQGCKLLPSVKDAKAIPTEVPICSARRYVAETFRFKDQYPERYKERVEGYKAALQYDIEHADVFFNSRKYFIIEWMKRHLKNARILEAFNPGLDVESALNSVDIENCPAVRLYFRSREKRIRAGNPPNDNDVDDWIFLPVVPYADLVLTERNLRTFILQADGSFKSTVVSDPTEAVAILKKWTS